MSPRLRECIKGKLEGWLCLRINREKKRVLELLQSGLSLRFLTCNLRCDRHQYGRPQPY